MYINYYYFTSILVYIIYLKNTILVYIFLFVFIEIIMGTIGKDYLMNQWESANTFINYLVNVVSKNLWFLLIIATIFLLILTMIQKIEKKHVLDPSYDKRRESIH